MDIWFCGEHRATTKRAATVTAAATSSKGVGAGFRAANSVCRAALVEGGKLVVTQGVPSCVPCKQALVVQPS